MGHPLPTVARLVGTSRIQGRRENAVSPKKASSWSDGQKDKGHRLVRVDRECDYTNCPNLAGLADDPSGRREGTRAGCERTRCSKGKHLLSKISAETRCER